MGVYPDRVLLHTWMAVHHLAFLPVSSPMLGDDPIQVHVVRCVVEGSVYTVSNGALKGTTMGGCGWHVCLGVVWYVYGGGQLLDGGVVWPQPECVATVPRGLCCRLCWWRDGR